ncbi:hypothetical protein A0H81_04072 [Grifola frondosa]|uniref:Uncharacterized protein n=1 Tax=Grifola frondosa TaxID=5627 RepID=A0A1C7MJP5_GRIFR|nr:hypothetical protein A0H81_04072 [Grifola frondosa]
MPRARRNHIPFPTGGWGNDQTAAGGGDDGWGPGAAEADTMWGAATRTSPTMDDGNWNGNGEGNQGWSNNPDDFGAGTSGSGGVKDGWGIQPEPAQAGGNAKKSSSKKGNSHTFQPAAPADAWGTSHPSPNTGAWGRPAQSSRAPPAPPPAPAAAPAPAWSNWAREAKMLPKVTIPTIETAPTYPSLAPQGAAFSGDRPALSQQQRTQLLSSLLDDRQQAEGFPLQSQGAQSVDARWQQAALQQQLQQVQQAQQQAAARQAQAAHAQRRQAQPANTQQQQAQAREQLARENAALYHSLQQRQAQALLQQQQAYLMAKQNENVQHKHHAQSHSRRHEPVQQADSWDDWGGNNYGSGWNNQRASTIQEEDENEYYNEDDDEDEEEKYDDNDDYGENDDYDERDDGWGQNYNQKVRFSPAVSQSTIHATTAPQATPRTHHTHLRFYTYACAHPTPAGGYAISEPASTSDVERTGFF